MRHTDYRVPSGKDWEWSTEHMISFTLTNTFLLEWLNYMDQQIIQKTFQRCICGQPLKCGHVQTFSSGKTYLMTIYHVTLADTKSTLGLGLSFLFLLISLYLAKMLGADTINLYELMT